MSTATFIAAMLVLGAACGVFIALMCWWLIVDLISRTISDDRED